MKGITELISLPDWCYAVLLATHLAVLLAVLKR